MLFAACTPDNEIIESGNIDPLVFSADTVIFDTIFTSEGSITKRLIVKNPNRKAVNIGQITLGKGPNSSYSILVNGVEQDAFVDEQLLGEDSLLILVKVFISPDNEELPFLIKDSIVFNTNNIQQDVKLISYGQNANFLNDSILSCDVVWDSPIPYVISNSILIDTLCSLTIKKGVRIFSDNNSFIFIKGRLIVEGDLENPVVFSNTRMDEDFTNAPGQWGGIIFLPGSKNNTVDFANIRNAAVGLNLDTFDQDTIPELVVSNTIIENMSASGILTIGADVFAYNVLINNCAEFMSGNFGGGYHTYVHCTMSNANSDFFRQNSSVVFTDNFTQNNRILVSDLNLAMQNCIVWGNLDEELFFNFTDETSNSLFISNSLLRTALDLDINDNILNINPNFIEPSIYNYRLDTLSPAKDQGVETIFTDDLDGNTRDLTPDLGAYERIESN